MDFTVQYLSFFVIQTDEKESTASKKYKHYQTLDYENYMSSEIKLFLDGEFARISKRKVEKNPNTEHAPTKIGTFMVEPGHDLTSNPNYNLFQRLIVAQSKQQFLSHSDELVRVYMDTSAVRGGALIVASAKLSKYFDEPFLFVMKCDFEPKIARISDEKSLISQVEMAISARNMKSIQYPYMPEAGIREEHELKIHQASHARYFEDFLKFVSYEKSMPEIVNDQVITMVQQYIEQKWPADDEEAQHEERQQEEHSFEIWAASDKRELQEKWDHEQVMDAAVQLVEHKEDLELRFKLDHVSIKGLLTDYGNKIHIASLNGKYVVLIEGDSFQFEKGVSPIELLKPIELTEAVQKINSRSDDHNEEPPWN